MSYWQEGVERLPLLHTLGDPCGCLANSSVELFGIAAVAALGRGWSALTPIVR